MTESLFPADSVSRRLDRELFVLLGGTAALLMQVSHPLVAAGVDDHSDFRRDPVARLRRTLDTTLAVVFGDPAAAERAIRRIDRRHGPIAGTAADGRTYAARDPALLLWVQSTLVLTSLRVYELVRGTLSPEQRDAYWQETKPLAMRLGIPEARLPGTVADLEAYERSALVRDVRPDATSVRIGRRVLRPFPWLPEPMHWPFDALTSGLLPPSLREPFGLRFRRRDRLLFRSMVSLVRITRRLLPDSVAAVPQARRHERTNSGGAGAG